MEAGSKMYLGEGPKNILGKDLMAQMAKNLPARHETQVRSLDWSNPLEEGMATHSSILALRIPWTEEPGGLQTLGSQRDKTERSTLTLTKGKESQADKSGPATTTSHSHAQCPAFPHTPACSQGRRAVRRIRQSLG